MFVLLETLFACLFERSIDRSNSTGLVDHTATAIWVLTHDRDKEIVIGTSIKGPRVACQLEWLRQGGPRVSA
jgi:hypothetical protein